MAIAVSFSLTGQDLGAIKPILRDLAWRYRDQEVIHGFMTREAIEQTGLSTELVDLLDDLFPRQKNFYGRRDDMIAHANRTRATVIFIGDLGPGSTEEYNAYLERAVKCNMMHLAVKE